MYDFLKLYNVSILIQQQGIDFILNHAFLCTLRIINFEHVNTHSNKAKFTY